MKKTNGYVEYPSMTKAVIGVFDKWPDNYEFSGWEIQQETARVYKEAKYTFPDTVLRRLRQYRRWQFAAIEPMQSKYRKIKPIFGPGIENGVDLRKAVREGCK